MAIYNIDINVNKDAVVGSLPEHLDLFQAEYSQVELCETTEIPMATANNWILTGALRPAEIGSRRTRRPRLFSLIAIFEAKVTAEMVKSLDISPLKAATMARQTTATGHNWYLSFPAHLGRASKPLDVYAIIFWSDRCRDWDVWVDLSSKEVLRIDFKEIGKKRSELRITERPLVVLPVGKYFALVYEKCLALKKASSNTRTS